MTSDQCTRYFEDPEGRAAHLAECAECRAIQQQLEARVLNQPVRVEALPLAPWEGADHRSWPLVIGGALTVTAIAAALFAAASTSPIDLFVQSFRGSVTIARSMVGVGGGIFLTPLLVLGGWAKPKEAAAVSAVFIFANSLAGLGGLYAGGSDLSPHAAFPAWAAAALCGGWVGAQWGSRRARPAWLRPTLAVVLFVAAVKFAGKAF